MPAIAVESGVTIGIAQIAFSAAMVALALSTLIYGPLSDRYGRLPMLYVGLVLFMIGTAVALISTSVTMLIVATITAPMIAIVLGGIITDLLGWRWIFGVSLILGALVVVLAWTTMRGSETGRSSVSSVADMLRGYGRLFRAPVYLGFILQGGFGADSFFSFIASVRF